MKALRLVHARTPRPRLLRALGHDILAALLAEAAGGCARLCNDGTACGPPRTQDAPASDVHERRLRVRGEELLDVNVCARHCMPVGPVQHACMEHRPCKLRALMEAQNEKTMRVVDDPRARIEQSQQGVLACQRRRALSGCKPGERGGAKTRWAVQLPKHARKTGVGRARPVQAAHDAQLALRHVQRALAPPVHLPGAVLSRVSSMDRFSSMKLDCGYMEEHVEAPGRRRGRAPPPGRAPCR